MDTHFLKIHTLKAVSTKKSLVESLRIWWAHFPQKFNLQLPLNYRVNKVSLLNKKLWKWNKRYPWVNIFILCIYPTAYFESNIMILAMLVGVWYNCVFLFRLLCVHHENVRPDMVVLGKALSGGMMPVSSSFST